MEKFEGARFNVIPYKGKRTHVLMCDGQLSDYLNGRGYTALEYENDDGIHVYESTDRLKRELFILAIIKQGTVPPALRGAFGIPR